MQDRQTIPIQDKFAHSMSVLEEQLKCTHKKLWEEFEKSSGIFWEGCRGAGDWSQVYLMKEEEALEYRETLIRTLESLGIKPLE